MFNETIKQIKIALLMLILFTVLTGLIYPLIVTGLAQLFFPSQANGSLIEIQEKIVGSQLIGQSFSDPKYFWGRPSATSPYPYNAAASSGSNMGPSNPAFLASIQERANQFKNNSSQNTATIPVDLVTASSSGLDPEISPLAAYFQVPRIAKSQHMSESEITELIQRQIKMRTFMLLGEPRVNVLQLNLALDHLRSDHA